MIDLNDTNEAEPRITRGIIAMTFAPRRSYSTGKTVLEMVHNVRALIIDNGLEGSWVQFGQQSHFEWTERDRMWRAPTPAYQAARMQTSTGAPLQETCARAETAQQRGTHSTK